MWVSLRQRGRVTFPERPAQETNPYFNSLTSQAIASLFEETEDTPNEDIPKATAGYALADLYPICEKLEIAGFIFDLELLKKVGYNELYENQYQN